MSKNDAAEPAPEALSSPAPCAFPIVGIGCSAGGLEALEKFFSHTPVASGMAFVVVQHLDPERPSALPELLQRMTTMPVTEIAGTTPVVADSVYVVTPNTDLSILHGVLHPMEPIAARGHRLPIDYFLRSLAEDSKEMAIGVVLSGMGSDGMFGLRAIKDNAGLTLVQDPTSAGADAMPNAAIAADVVDIVALAEDLPLRILSFLKNPAQLIHTDVLPSNKLQNALDQIVILLRERSGNDFSLYKTNTLYRRIERRIALHQIASIGDYVRFLRENPEELDLLFKELLIGVTSFFRDPAMWDYLRTDAIPELVARHTNGKALRAWVPACSTGEEAYSLAITFKEALSKAPPEAQFSVQIYATDLDADAINKARKGVYPANIAADVAPELLMRYFIAEDTGYRLRKDVREMVVFAEQNIVSDPPFTKLDVLSCRNLLIYFSTPLQQKLLPLMHYALARDGLLVLGSAETTGNSSYLFSAVNQKQRIFRRSQEEVSLNALELPVKSLAGSPPGADAKLSEQHQSIGQLTDQLIQQTYAPPAVLVNADGDIVYISGRTGKYLEPAAGKMNVNIHAMARDGLRSALVGVIHQALRDPKPIELKRIKVGTNGDTKVVDVTVQAIENPEVLRGRVLLVFHDVLVPPKRRGPRKSAASGADEALQQELLQTREALQVTHEEMQSSVEELKSSNEELQSTNEELQSTNKELITSKEELQSLNEEMQTVNAELQTKVEDLSSVRNDMTNLLNSTEVATLFLDNTMNLRRYTPHATDLFKLIPGDVGRPLSHIVTDLNYPQLKDDALEVLRSLIFQEKEAVTHDGRWFRVRLMPYRTQDNMIDGVVITFMDVTAIKQLEAELRQHALG